MIEEFGYSVVIPLLLGVISYFGYRLYTSGLFDELKVSVVEHVPHLSKPVTVYYKYHVGPYKGVKKIYDEVSQLVPRRAKTFGLYYDDPRETKEELCQSAVGVIFEEDGTSYEDNYATQLNRWGYERMVLPAVERAVVARQPFNGFMSLLVMIYKSYKTVAQFITENRLETGLSVEVYSFDGKGKCVVDILFPLDHLNEFYVHEHMSTEALESKLARRHFDSDLSESESEPEYDEESDGEQPETEVDPNSGN
uniref:Testis-expressed sequence 264 protein n=1 Tax=Steinernema glaseri TaxID=37863 RepID=A0A1I8AP37_9BILA